MRLDDRVAEREHGFALRDGRWWLRRGEITAPVWSEELQRNIYPPWWPDYTDPSTGETYNLAQGPHQR